MPEIRISYEDDSGQMPVEALVDIVRAAGSLTVTDLRWIRDDDLEDEFEDTSITGPPTLSPGELTLAVRPDLSRLGEAFRKSGLAPARPFPSGDAWAPYRPGRSSG